jgi:hypothetical protein
MNAIVRECSMKVCLGLGLFWLSAPAEANDAALLERALTRATATFEAALPQLDATEFGVDVAAYRDALTLGQFGSSYWGGTIAVSTSIRDGATGSCSRYAAFVRIPPENGVVSLVLCPQFFTDGMDGLRELTILHEMVHVVAGGDECRAMAFAARLQDAATGTFTPVDAYWQANECAGTAYRLP